MAVDQELARLRWKQGESASEKQRERVKDDLGFYEGETQWDANIVRQRQGADAIGNIPAVPPRPCLTINKVRDPIRKIQNDELQADLGMSIVPADDFGGDIDENEIELREGLARRIQRQSYAKDARMWAANRAAIAGEGYYGILTQFVKGSHDQEIIYRRFLNQFSVMLDPMHEQPDGSDAEWAFVGRDMPWDLYKAEYPRLASGRPNPAARDGLDEQEFRAFGDEAPTWFNTEDKTRTVRVSEYWFITRKTRWIALLADGSSVVTELEPTVDKITVLDAREETVKQIKFSVIDGVHTLSETDWPGQFIPIIKVVGEEMHSFDQERRYEGLIRPARGPQKAYNAMISAAVEMIAMAPKSPWLVSSRAIENYEQQWIEQATRNWSAMIYNDIDPATGQQIAPPQRNQAEPPIQAMALMLGAFDQGIMATIGQASLADTHPDVRSGAMAGKLIDEAARGTSNYLANLIRSVHYEGAIINDLEYPIYGTRPGRIVSMMGKSGKAERVMIGQPFVTPTPGGMPQAHQPGVHPPEMQPKTYTLTKDGSFNVAIEVNKFYETKQQETVALLAGMIEKSPEIFMPIVGDRFMELVGDEDMAKRFRAVLAPPIQEMLKEGQPVDPRLTQAMQMGQQLAQEMMQLKADKHARIEQAQIKALSDTTTTDHDNATKLQIAQSHDATLLAIEEMKIKLTEQAKAVEYLMKADEVRQEAARTQEKFMEERRLSNEQQDHEHTVAHHGRAHELAMSVVEHQHAKDALEHEAAVMPKPTSNGSGE